jgi:branched-chain amino acid transport system permease protein
LAFIVGWGFGGIIHMITGRLRAARLMIVFLIVSDAFALLVSNSWYVAGGTLGAFVPNLVSWYNGENMLILALTTMLVGIICFFIIRTMINSPFGRLMRAVRGNEWTVSSTGKSVDSIRRDVTMYASGMMAVSGVLHSLYFSFVQYELYGRLDYTFWPWLMITLGGIGNNAGTFLGVLICIFILRGFGVIRGIIVPFIRGTGYLVYISSIESMLLATLLILFFIFKPLGILQEKKLRIPGINYRGIVWNPDKTVTSDK